MWECAACCWAAPLRGFQSAAQGGKMDLREPALCLPREGRGGRPTPTWPRCPYTWASGGSLAALEADVKSAVVFAGQQRSVWSSQQFQCRSASQGHGQSVCLAAAHSNICGVSWSHRGFQRRQRSPAPPVEGAAALLQAAGGSLLLESYLVPCLTVMPT